MEATNQWPRIKEIVGAALERAPDERYTFLDIACSENPNLREEVDSLLAAYEHASGLSRGPWEVAPGEPPALPAMIGPYRLIRELGTGGMGQVWLAEQTSPVSRKCALKLIKSGIYDADAVRRFQAERQSLALMDHPAIAKVFEAGTTSSGQPYLAMEYVDGLPINEYCDGKQLGLRERLTLFLQVCDGVQHAHQKAIIHRDLKPSNILVIEIDGKPCPRIIDFGLAKAVGPAQDQESFMTLPGALLGTPGYMSPEQTDLSIGDIDTRTDVYSLGVVLYELLTGVLPFNSSRFKKQHLDEMLRELRDAATERPSSKVNMSGNTLVQRAANRGAEPRSLASLLRGDLDWVTMKALEKERERRYGTASEFAADIRRYLDDLPILAAKASAGYRLRKYIRRHRIAVSVAASAVLLVLAFAAMQTVQLHQTRQERDRADRITNFMTSMFTVSDPSEARGNSVTAREILDKSSTQIKAELGRDVEVQSQLLAVMAQTYLNLGLFSRAHGLAELALQNRQRSLGPNHPKTLASMTQLGFILYHEGHDRDAEKMIRHALELEERRLGPDDALTLETKDDLAIVLEREGLPTQAEKLDRELVAVRSRKLGPEAPLTLRSINNLAGDLRGESRFPEAEAEYRRLMEIQQRVLGATHPATIATTHNLANLLQDQGRYGEAEVLYRKAISVSQRVLGPEHPDTASTMITLANAIAHTDNRRAEAESLYRKSLDIESRVAGPDNSETTRAEEGLANLLSSERHYDEAEKRLRNVLDVRQRLLGPDHTDTLITQYNLGLVLFHENRYVEAEELIRKTVDQQTKVLGVEDPDTMAASAFLARILLAENNPEAAEKLARKAFNSQLRILGPQHGDTLDSLHYLGDALVKLHRYSEVDPLFDDAIARIASIKNGDASFAWYSYACAATLEGQREKALDHLEHAVKAGGIDAETMRVEVDLKPLHSSPRFTQLVRDSQSH